MAQLRDKVTAVVLTYRRPRLAAQVVRSLLDVEGFDPTRVVVVVNGEGGLADRQLEDKVTMLRLADNLGPAGGFRAGITEAFSDPDVAWVYLCEDDVGLFDLPTPRVARVVEAAESIDDGSLGAVVAYGRDRRGRGGHTLAHRVSQPEGFEEVDVAAWGATLLSRRVFEAGVLPDPDYFFGFEDFDFFYRLREAGFKVLVDRESASSGAKETEAARTAAFAGERPGDAEEPWRAYYVARNFFRLARRNGTPPWIVFHLAYTVRRLTLARSAAERTAILRGVLDGATGRRGRNARYQRSLGERAGASAVKADSGLPPESDTESPSIPASPRTILHLLPVDIARGAQVYARDLANRLDSPGERHLVAILFRSETVVLPDAVRLDLVPGRLRAVGFDPRVLARLRKLLADTAPAVVVAHGGEPLKYAALLADGRFGLVYYAIGIVTSDARSGWRRSLYRWLLGRCDTVAGVSAETLSEASECFGVRADRLVLVVNGRDPNLFAPPVGGRVASATTRLLWVGHLTATKRPEWFVDTVSRLRSSGLDVSGRIVGDGPLHAALASRAAAAGVEMLGDRQDVATLLGEADVAVFTSEAQSEGMPGVLIEAGLSGLPVVATDVPGASTVIADGSTGFVVPQHDFDALVERVRQLVKDPGLRQEMGAAARRRCERDFSADASVAAWRRLLAAVAPQVAVGPNPTGPAGSLRRTEG